MSTDLYQQVTDQIIAALETGTPPWVRPWSTVSDAIPSNATTGRAYRGITVLVLGLRACMQGYQHNRWLTYLQAQALGAHIRKGESGTAIAFYKLNKIVSAAGGARESAEHDAQERFIPLLRAYTVFNVAQVDDLPAGLTPSKPTALPAWEVQALADRVLEASGADIRYGGDRAFYHIATDRIQLPPQAAFADLASHYSTALHELVHWTSAAARCDRQLSRRFGDAAYAAEELIAEIGSSFLCAHCHIDGKLQHAAYVHSWLDVLKQDKRAVFTAAAKAQQEADYLLGRIHNQTEPVAEAVTA
jgi:antirestriction protein ArdC